MIADRLRLVLSKGELDRIQVRSQENDIRIIADVHGMKCYEAKRFINNIINLVRMSFKLIVIHGYNHGTAIKDMLSQSFRNNHVSEQYPDPCNQGITCMLIAA